jgi:hypothetical protein
MHACAILISTYLSVCDTGKPTGEDLGVYESVPEARH